jgi:hypothetical protein
MTCTLSAEFIGLEQIREPVLDPGPDQAAVIYGKKLDQLVTAKDRHPHLDKVDDPVVPTRSGEARDPVGIPAFPTICRLCNPEPQFFRNVKRLVDLGHRHNNVVVTNPNMRVSVEKSRILLISFLRFWNFEPLVRNA